MPDSVRQALSVLALFGGGFVIFLAYGMSGVGIAAIGFFLCWLCIGLATGYWCGTDGDTERMVTDLMLWIRKQRSSAEPTD